MICREVITNTLPLYTYMVMHSKWYQPWCGSDKLVKRSIWLLPIYIYLPLTTEKKNSDQCTDWTHDILILPFLCINDQQYLVPYYYKDYFWLSCLYLWFSCSQRLVDYWTFQSFDFERTWWWLFQKPVVHTKFDIYVFIFRHFFLLNAFLHYTSKEKIQN